MSLTVAVYTIGKSRIPSTRFRILQYLPYLDLAGIKVTCFMLPSGEGGRIRSWLGIFWQAAVRFWQLSRAPHFDLLVIQKGLTWWRCRGLVAFLLSRRVPYVMDLDDAVHLTQHLKLPPYLRWLQNDGEARQLIENASSVVAGNAFLAESVRRHNHHVTVIPTPVDTARFKPRGLRAGKRLVIGWSGTEGANFYVNLALPILSRLAEEHAFEFLVISKNLN